MCLFAIPSQRAGILTKAGVVYLIRAPSCSALSLWANNLCIKQT